MKIAINSEVLAKDSITMQQFAVLLYYLADGTGVLNDEICKYLWYRGFLEKKEGEEGYFINANLLYQIQGWIASSWASPESTAIGSAIVRTHTVISLCFSLAAWRIKRGSLAGTSSSFFLNLFIILIVLNLLF